MTAGQSSQQTQSGMCGEPIADRTSHPQTLNVEDILCEIILLYFFTSIDLIILANICVIRTILFSYRLFVGKRKSHTLIKSDLHYVTFADLMTSREYYFLSALLCNGSKNRSNFCISVKFVDSCFAFVECLRFDMNQISIDLI